LRRGSCARSCAAALPGSRYMNVLAILDRVFERLTPTSLAEDIDTRKRVRMFLISHVFGPFLGLPIPAVLYFADPSPWPQVPILAASIAGFWLFVPLLRVFPRHFPLLAF